jgi:intergrase/recombinase
MGKCKEDELGQKNVATRIKKRIKKKKPNGEDDGEEK